MKKKNWISLLLIVCCLGALVCYRALDRIRTDSKAPVITVEEQLLEVSVQAPRKDLLAGVTARDDRDGDVTASLVVESVRMLGRDGMVTVTYAAFDKAGNVAKQTREVRYTDYGSPRFSLSRPLIFAQGKNRDVLAVISAEDPLDGDITHRIRAAVLDEVTSGYSGSYDVKFRVTNSLGDTEELVLPVEVYTPGAYEAELTLTDYLIYLKQGDSFNARDYLETFAMGREETSLLSGVPEELKLTVSGKVETGVPGIYVVDYEMTQRTESSKQVYTAYSRLIVIVEG